MSATFDTVYTAYHTTIDALSGYTPNEKINDETYSSRSTANKQFFLEFEGGPEVDEGISSGNTEIRDLNFNLKILYSYPGATYAVNEAATLTLINAVIIAIYGVTFSGYGNVSIGNFTLGPLSNGFKLCTVPFAVKFTWSTV
jgi:hypothetical protein